YALDYTTGERLWTANGPFVSNAAVSQGRVYALHQDGRLVILDETTGEELGFVQFSPAETPSPTYWVGADDQGRIYVYFSDSQELISMKVN
ncbi:MAG: PQQ-binding-like beta-propeller repeat protein, partial [Gammaproteobacteria bacterium]|nr:PQQ-binding-like beta-propeller repeat protein [Gammaproteobacteria bacterium]NIW96675.1 PQQ-binding-like beta-propeller repeat protein [Phycisphaerae bacterium]